MANSGNAWYYAWSNPNSALSMALHKEGLGFGIRYLKDILSVKVSMFRYKNIEKIPNLTSEILETAITFGWCLCFYESGAGLGLYRFVPQGELNPYLKPTTVNIEALNGSPIAQNVPYDDIILVRDNSIGIAPFVCMVEYIRQIDRIDNTIFRVLNTLSLPIVIAGNKKLTGQLKETAKKLGSSDPYIVGDDNLVDQVKMFNIDMPINPADVYLLKTKYKNELLTSIGIYSVEEKRERKIVSEVASQNDYTDHVYNDMLMQRKEFVSKLNSKYGLNIELVESYKETVKETVREAIEMAKAQGVASFNQTKEPEKERVKDDA